MTKDFAKNGKFTPIEEFIERAQLTHGSKYDYTKVQYNTLKDKVTIICPEHGEFTQTPKLHFKQGCKLCGVEKRASNRRHSLESFIEKAVEVHADVYDYSDVVYKNSSTYVDITCKLHGIFSQVANAHLQGNGCPHCGLLSQVTSRDHHGGWSYTEWKKSGLASSNFVGFQLYVIRCWNDTEEFLKIGKTYRTLAKRFCTVYEMPYKYQVLAHIFDTAERISILEHTLQSVFKDSKYTPTLLFAGKSECVMANIQQELLKTLNEKITK